MDRYYKIAGLIVRMDSYGRTIHRAEPYIVEPRENADIQIESNWLQRKHEYPRLSDEDGEYLATGASFYRQLLDHEGLMLHSSAVAVDGVAYLFTADSGTGKSTHTGLWLEQFGDKTFILNDDKPALRLINGVWYAFGTPWSGKHDISVNTGVPVAGIAVLERGESNEIARFGGMDAIQAILRQSNRPRAAEYRIKLLDLLDKLITQVPIWKLKCNMDPEAAIVAYEAMSGEKWRKE